MDLAERWNVPPWTIAEADAAELFGALDVIKIRDGFDKLKGTDQGTRGRLN